MLGLNRGSVGRIHTKPVTAAVTAEPGLYFQGVQPPGPYETAKPPPKEGLASRFLRRIIDRIEEVVCLGHGFAGILRRANFMPRARRKYPNDAPLSLQERCLVQAGMRNIVPTMQVRVGGQSG